MSSMYWTDEEARYIQAIFAWQNDLDQDTTGRSARNRTTSAASTPAGEFRILLLGPQGVGKTSLITRFCANRFDAAALAPNLRFPHRDSHPLVVDGRIYAMHVMELPSQYLNRGPAALPRTSVSMLDHALDMIEAAVVVYDVCDAASFAQARHLYNQLTTAATAAAATTTTSTKPRRLNRLSKQASMRFRRPLGGVGASKGVEPTAMLSERSPKAALRSTSSRDCRPFVVYLVGNKCDISADPAGGTEYGGHVRRCVTWQQGLHTVAPTAATAFWETSARSGANVDALFVHLSRAILQQRASEAHRARLRMLDTELALGAASAASSTSASDPEPLQRCMNKTPGTVVTSTRHHQRRATMLRMLRLPFGRRPTPVEATPMPIKA